MSVLRRWFCCLNYCLLLLHICKCEAVGGLVLCWPVFCCSYNRLINVGDGCFTLYDNKFVVLRVALLCLPDVL